MIGQIRHYPERLNWMSDEELREHKEALLRQNIRHMYENSPEYYQVKLKECGAQPEDIRTIEDLRKLPIIMDKDSERQSMEASYEKYGHPFGLHLCCHPEDVVATGVTGGSSGNPTYPYTVSNEDYKFISEAMGWLHNEVLGLGPGDRAFFLFPLGPYATSVMMLPGIRQAGILPLEVDIRLGTQPALNTVKWTHPTFWWTGPTTVLHYAEHFRNKLNIDPKDLGFKCLLLSGEMGIGMPEVKRTIESTYGCRAYDYWAPSATSLSLSCNSEEYYGLHNFADDWDICFEDLVDPETWEPIEVKDGAVGEYIVTHLRKKASPYLRYATGDIVEVSTSECPACGFKGYRANVIGRSDDMLTVKGVSIFGRVIKENIQNYRPRVTGRMRIIKEDPSPRITKLKLRVERGVEMDPNQLNELAEEIKSGMKSQLRVSPEIEWTEPESLQVSFHKEPLFEKRY